MSQLAHPKLSLRQGSRRRHAAPGAQARTAPRPAPVASNAAPLTLAAVVVVDLLLAGTIALVSALGG